MLEIRYVTLQNLCRTSRRSLTYKYETEKPVIKTTVHLFRNMPVSFRVTFQEYGSEADTNYGNTYAKRTKYFDVIKYKIGF